jgi:hypothetical protein
MARCAVRRPALSCPRRAGRNSAGQQRESASGDIAAQCPYQSAVRRGIFVEPQTKIIFSPVGAASSVRTPDDVAPDGARFIYIAGSTNMSALTGFQNLCSICVSSVAKNSNAHCPVYPPQTAIGRPAGTFAGWNGRPARCGRQLADRWSGTRLSGGSPANTGW